MSEISCILHACAINGKGGAKPLEGEALTKHLQSDDLAWVHLDAAHPDTRDWLQENLNYLDPIILDALLADETRPRVMEINDGLLMILRGMNFNENASPEDMISIRVWADPHRIVTLRRRRLKAVVDIKEKLDEGRGFKDTGHFIAQLTTRLFERMEPVMAELDERVDDIEEKILENPDPKEREEIIDIRKKAIIFRRYIAPQKDVMSYLRLTELPLVSAHNKRHLQESLDRVTRYVEDLDAIRERSQIVKDELANMLSDRLNKNLYILSVISAIFLPLGFFTGLMGINIGGMPGVDNENAFWIFSGVLTIMVAIQMFIFKKLKWF
jgi:zinc transporter